MGFYGEDEIPPPPYACSKCKRVFQTCDVENSRIHIKAKKKHGGGFWNTWALKCPEPSCRGAIRALELIRPVQESFGF